jgi:hypothetical protein
MEKSDRSIKLPTIIYALVIFVVAFLFIFGLVIYKTGISNQFVSQVSKVIPYPAAIIDNSSMVTIRSLEKNTAAVRSFYEKQDLSDSGFRVDFTTPDGHKRLLIRKKYMLGKMIENKIVERLAKDRKITVDADALVKETQASIAAYESSGGSFMDDLKNLYGWNLKDFQENIVVPNLLEGALQENVFESENDFVAAKKKIEDAASALDGKQKFEDVVKKYSEGESAASAGELGWFSIDQMTPQVAVAVVNLAKGERSAILQSALGYHVVELEDKKSEDGVQKFKIRQIFVRTVSFADWLIEQEKNAKIYIPLSDFRWNKDEAQVPFTDNELQQFEDNLNKNSDGDISVMF